MAGDYGTDYGADHSHPFQGTAAVTISIEALALGTFGGDVAFGFGDATISIEAAAAGTFVAPVTGTGAAIVSIEAAAVGEFTTPVVVVPVVPRGPTVQAGFMLPVDEREFFQKKKKIKPVVGKGVAVITLTAKAKGVHGVTGVGAAIISIEAEAHGEFFDAVDHDNAFLLMAA